MIDWNNTEEVTPAAGREIIVRNPNKDISYSSSAKQCKSMKFLPSLDNDFIKESLLDEGFTQWVYVEDGA